MQNIYNPRILEITSCMQCTFESQYQFKVAYSCRIISISKHFRSYLNTRGNNLDNL